MPKSRRYPMAELPGTLQRSCWEAQQTFLWALDDAVRAHGAGDQAHRIAYLALKQKFEKRGDHWIAKDNPADGGGGGGRGLRALAGKLGRGTRYFSGRGSWSGPGCGGLGRPGVSPGR